MTHRKWLAILLVATFALATASGCGSGAADSSDVPPTSSAVSAETDATSATDMAVIDTDMSLDEYLIAVSIEQARNIFLSAVFLDLHWMPNRNIVDPLLLENFASYRIVTPDNLQSADVFDVSADTDAVLRALLGEEYLEETPDDLTGEHRTDISERAAFILPQMMNNLFGATQSATARALTFSAEYLSHKDFSGVRCVVLNFPDDKAVWATFSLSELTGTLRVGIMPIMNFERYGEDLTQILNRLTEKREHYDSWIEPPDNGFALPEDIEGTTAPPVETSSSLDEYLTEVATELAQKIQLRANPFYLRLVSMPPECLAYAEGYTSITPDSPQSVELFNIRSEADAVMKTFMSESDYTDFVDIAPGELKREELNELYNHISELAPYYIPQCVNTYMNTQWMAAAGSFNFSAQCPSHEDFEGTRCVMLSYDEYMGIWVIFSRSGITNVLNVDVIATRSFEEIRNEELWGEVDTFLDGISAKASV